MGLALSILILRINQIRLNRPTEEVQGQSIFDLNLNKSDPIFDMSPYVQ